MDSLNIEDYKSDLLKVCDNCKRSTRCKDHSSICFSKKLLFNLSKAVYKSRLKKGILNERS